MNLFTALLDRLGYYLLPKATFPSEQRTYQFSPRDKDRLIHDNQPLIHELKLLIEFPQPVFDRNVMPVIKRIAEHCLMLPASEYFHHKEAGSLFYHLIETGTIAANLCKNREELISNAQYKELQLAKSALPYTAFLAGVLHDIAKPTIDFEVIPLDRRLNEIPNPPRWLPREQSLHAYLKSCKAHHYRVHFIPERDYYAHSEASLLYMPLLLSCVSKDFFAREWLEKLLVQAFEKDKPFYRLIVQADMISTDLDRNRFKQWPVQIDMSAQFVSAFQDYDRVNRDKASKYYFVSSWGIHIEYPDGVKDITKLLRRNTLVIPDAEQLIPESVEKWVEILGPRHHLLTPNHDPKNKTHVFGSVRNDSLIEAISPYISKVIVKREGMSFEHTVITLKRENVYLQQVKQVEIEKVVYLSAKIAEEASMPAKQTSKKTSKKGPVKQNSVPSMAEAKASETAGKNTPPSQTTQATNQTQTTPSEDKQPNTTHLPPKAQVPDNQPLPPSKPAFVDPDVVASIANISFTNKDETPPAGPENSHADGQPGVMDETSTQQLTPPGDAERSPSMSSQLKLMNKSSSIANLRQLFNTLDDESLLVLMWITKSIKNSDKPLPDITDGLTLTAHGLLINEFQAKNLINKNAKQMLTSERLRLVNRFSALKQNTQVIKSNSQNEIFFTTEMAEVLLFDKKDLIIPFLKQMGFSL